MIFEFRFSEKSKKDFAKLEKKIQKKMLSKLKFIEKQNPLLFAKKLKGENDLFRFRMGNHRLIFSLQKEKDKVVLLFIKIGHRKDIYK